MANLPGTPSLWLDFSAGIGSSGTTIQNLGWKGGSFNRTNTYGDGVYYPDLNRGVYFLNNSATSSGRTITFNETPSTADYTLCLGFAIKDSRVYSNLTYFYLLSGNYLRPSIQIANNSGTGIFRLFNGSTTFDTTDTSLKPEDGKFYVLVMTNSWHDGYSAVKMYDATTRVARLNHQFNSNTSYLSFNHRALAGSQQDLRIGGFYSSINTYNTGMYVGNFNYWETGMTEAQLDIIASYYLDKYSQVPNLNGKGYNQDVVSANYAIPLKQTNNTSTSDYTGGFNTVDVQVGAVKSKKLYIGFKNTASTAEYGDIAFSHIQILTNTGTSFRTGPIYDTTVRAYDFVLASPSNGSYSYGNGRWEYMSGTTSDDISLPSNDPSVYTYAVYSPTANNGAVAGRWVTATGTATSYVGAADGTWGNGYTGIAASGQEVSGGSILPSNSTGGVSQVSGTYYAYVECSGFTTNHATWMRTFDSLTLEDGDIIRICYLYAMNPNVSGGLQDLNGTLFLRFA